MLYRLTSSGSGAARKSGAVDRQTEQLIREQASLRFCKEAARLTEEGVRALRGDFEDLTRKGLLMSSVAAGRAVGRISSIIEGMAKACVQSWLTGRAEAGVPLDRERAERVKAEVRSVVGGAKEAWLRGPQARVLERLGDYCVEVQRGLARRCSEIEAECRRQIDIALNAELLKAKNPTDETS